MKTLFTLFFIAGSAFATNENFDIKCKGWIGDSSGMKTVDLYWVPNSNIIEGEIDQRIFAVSAFKESLSVYSKLKGKNDSDLNASNLHWPTNKVGINVSGRSDAKTKIGIYCEE